jgi:hypothetical protein
LRYGYLLWAGVVVAGWVVLAVLSDDPRMKWGFTIAATMFAVGTFLIWRDRRKQDARSSEEVD